MKHSFYDVKAKEKVNVDVAGKTPYGEPDKLRYAFKGVTKDGRDLTAFVSKADYDKADVKVIKAPKKK